MIARFLLAFLFLFAPVLDSNAARQSIALRSFESGGMAQVRAQHQGRPFILALWSLDCVYCIPDLETLAKFSKQQTIPLVLVNTGSMEQKAAILDVLHRLRLNGAENWVFGSESPERLRFEIDRRWYGELPRTYFFDVNGDFHAVSGAVPIADLQMWARENSSNRSK